MLDGAPSGKTGKKGRIDVPDRVKIIVWARAAGHCQFGSCNRPLIGHLEAGNRNIKKGYVAHIIGASADGPRGDPELSALLAKHPDNVMLLCDGCHTVVDNDPKGHPAELLRQMKQDKEAWISRVVGLGPDSKSHVLRFSNIVGSNETAIPLDECLAAMRGIGKTPATFEPIDLKIGTSELPDFDSDFWRFEARSLRQACRSRLWGRAASGEIRHLSAFGFGPMPLLMEFGTLIPNHLDVEVFGRIREPSATWTWTDEMPKMKPRLVEGVAGPRRVALKLAITDRIADDRITRVLGIHDLSIWEITCTAPRHDVVRTREDASEYRNVVRTAFNRMKEVHGEDVEVHVFPAAPAVCCVEFGRVWQPKAHAPMEVYDQVDGAFVRQHRIENVVV
jgi:hypothetical protein